MANCRCTVSKCRIIIQGGGLHSDDRCPHLLREKNFHERHHGFWRSSSFIVMTHGVIRLTQNSSQLCCNTVIVACHHFISSSLNVKESPSCNIWIILEKIMISIMANGSWPIIMIWFPQGLCLLLTPAVPAAGKLHHYDHSDYHFIIDFLSLILLSLYHWFLVIPLSLIFLT